MCLVVKRLSDAITCGDPIRAVIRNTVTSHCGRTKGITMPSQAAQEELLLHVHQAVGLDPGETAFVEVNCCPQGCGFLAMLTVSRVMVLALKLGRQH